MIREVDLVSYLPPFIADYKEDRAALEAENPEFNLVWEAVDKLYKNEFILDADEYGISRFEHLLKLHPYDTDDLEVRRLRVLAEWFKRVPYTFPWLKDWMKLLCGGTEGHKEAFTDYLLSIQLDRNTLDLANEIMGIVLEILPSIIPSNMVLEIGREWQTTGKVYVGAFTAIKEVLEVWPELVSSMEMTGETYTGSMIAMNGRIEVFPKMTSKLEITGEAKNSAITKMDQEIQVYPGLTTRIESAAAAENMGITSTRNTIEIYPE